MMERGFVLFRYSVYVVYVVTKGCGYTFPYLCYVVLSENWFASGSLLNSGKLGCNFIIQRSCVGLFSRKLGLDIH